MTDMQGETSATRAPGWYRDPAPANPAFPTTVRYWNGSDWTAQTRPAKKSERQSWQAELAAEQHARAAAYAEELARVATPAQLEAMAQAQSRVVTMDGQPLSGWWRRYGAAVLDAIAEMILTTAFGWPFVNRIRDAFSQYVDAAVVAAQNGSVQPDPTATVQSVQSAFLGLTLVSIVVSFVYHVGFLKAFNATPGKMALGIEVRLRDRPGVLPWRAVLLRWLVRFGLWPVSLVPFGGFAVYPFWLLDGLWPLWDPRRQALHDHAAGTQVCRR